MKTELIRKTWPKIRPVTVKGEKFYQVDARRQGTNGRRETFAVKKDAETRAAKIEEEFAGNGTEGLAMPADLRAAAFTAQKILAPFGKSIVQAAEFYREHLQSRQKAQESALVPVLAQKWYDDKASGRLKKLRPASLRELRHTSGILADHFAGVRILDVSTKTVSDFLDGQKVGLQRKYNLCNLFSQFFNWCIAQEHIEKNPAEKIEIQVGGKEVAIFTPAQAEALLNVCQEQFPAYTLYHAICLFAGLRPEECQQLEWEQIHLEERTIHVLAKTSKIKEARNVHIEDSLLTWFIAFKPTDAKGYVTPQVNFKRITLFIHIAAGFQGTTVKKDNGTVVYTKVNESAPMWPQDVLRHSYGSYWLGRYGNRAQLAENMGNSIQIIKKHYKRVVSKSETAQYWAILPIAAKKRARKDEETARQAFPTT